jgi:DMSO/TMAO reductase YedYZ molybdopterin-dependent catalytic subunit
MNAKWIGQPAGGAAGVLAGGAALGVAELFAGFAGGAGASPLIAVGAAGITLTPEWLKDFAIRHFGTNDKLVLLIALGVGIGLLAVMTGIAARRHFAAALAGFAALGLVGAVAAVTRPGSGWTAALPSAAGCLAGAAALTLLVRAMPGRSADRAAGAENPPEDPRVHDLRKGAPTDNVPGGADAEDVPGDPGVQGSPGVAGDGAYGTDRRNLPTVVGAPAVGGSSIAGAEGLPGAPGVPGGEGLPGHPGVQGSPGVARDGAYGADRRTLLLTVAGTVVVGGASAVGGRLLLARDGVGSARRAVRLPRPASPAAVVPAGAQVRVPGMTPFVTDTRDFYRVDTALTLPQVSPRDWTLRIHGMVDRPVEISFDDLLRRPLLERDITLTCVSNQVGGRYAGNARWLGASLAALLREAGVRSGADQVLSRSADGFTVSTPIETIMDGRDALLAVGMNGAALPVAHGFPARMVVPGLYGYVSATKWVTDLKVTRFATDRAYWTRRGYADHAPIKTLSRIDVPRAFARVKAGRVPVAGVAWAQHRGIDAVEVRADDGPWRRAELAPVPGLDTWRQWVLEWDAAPGSHRLEVRATDGTGTLQAQRRVPPAPDGATGWHSIVVTVA